MCRPDLYKAVAELGQFFRELCSRNIRIDALEHLREKIPTILCDLEKIYPPAFFDVMVHLAVHLPDEAVGECSNFKIFLRTRKIMVMHNNEMGECCPHTLVD